MAISVREVQNKRNSTGELTGKAGVVYDVNIKYRSAGRRKTYAKKGFSTKEAAQQHEAAMKAKLSDPSCLPPATSFRKRTVKEYMLEWMEQYGEENLRPSTKAGYLSTMKNHIFPYIGDVALKQLTPAMLDDMYGKIKAAGLSASVVRCSHKIMGVSLEYARKHHYIENNPARDILTKFEKDGDTPDPYTIEEMQQLFAGITEPEWQLILVLAGLYGLRRGEILGLRWRNVDMEKRTFSVIEQLPYDISAKTKELSEMAPVKAGERVLPITDWTLPYFQKQQTHQSQQKDLIEKSGHTYYDNDLVITKTDGSPLLQEYVSRKFKQYLQQLHMPPIRFHDLRHTAATNMYNLAGDFYTVGQILGHTLKGIGSQLNISDELSSITSHYVTVRVDRKLLVLNAYHADVLGKDV